MPEPRQIKIQQPFLLGLVATLGVGVGLLLIGIVTSLATVLTYVGAALFLALGLDPLVSWLVARRLPRWAALLTVVICLLAVVAGILLAIVPIVVTQATELITQFTHYFTDLASNPTWFSDSIAWMDQRLGGFIDVQAAVDGILQWLKDPASIANIGTGVVSVGFGIASGFFGALIVLILTLYFTASLPSIKRASYLFVPATRRARYIELSEQISRSVGNFVIGQGSQAAINGVLSVIMLSIIGAPTPVLLATVAFVFSLIPLVGTLSGSVIIVLVTLFAGPTPAIIAGIYYLVYMQVEAYVISPRIMARAVQVPGAVVVIAALAGGTLLGILGALVAIPVAAAIILIVKEVIIPRQNRF